MGEMLFSRPAGYRARCAPFSRNAWKGSQGSRCHLTPPRLSGKLGFLPLHPPGESRRDNLWCACRTAWVKCFSPSPPTTGLAVRLTPAIHGKALSVDFHSPLRADWQRLRHKAAFPHSSRKPPEGPAVVSHCSCALSQSVFALLLCKAFSVPPLEAGFPLDNHDHRLSRWFDEAL